MTTYTLARLLIVLGVVARTRADDAARADAAAHHPVVVPPSTGADERREHAEPPDHAHLLLQAQQRPAYDGDSAKRTVPPGHDSCTATSSTGSSRLTACSTRSSVYGSA